MKPQKSLVLGLHTTELQTSSTASVATERASCFFTARKGTDSNEFWLLDEHPDGYVKPYVMNPYDWVLSPINTLAIEILNFKSTHIYEMEQWTWCTNLYQSNDVDVCLTPEMY